MATEREESALPAADALTPADLADLRARAARLAFLLQLDDALRPLDTPAEIEDAATRVTRDFFGADRCYYCAIDGEMAIIRREASREGLPPVAGAYPLDELPLFREVVHAGRPILVADAATSPQLDNALRQQCRQLQLAAFLAVPVIKRGKPAGFFCLTQCAPRRWTGDDLTLATAVADRIWTAASWGRAETALAEDRAALRRVHALNARVLAPGWGGDLLQEIMETAVAAMQAQHGILRLLEGEALVIAAHVGHQPAFLTHFSADDPIVTACGDLLQHRKTVVVPDVETSFLFAGAAALPVLRAAGVRSFASALLQSRAGEFLGSLTVQWDTPHACSEHRLRRLELLARQAADLIVSSRARDVQQAAEAQLRLVLDNSLDGINLLDLRTGQYRLMNPAQVALTGFTAAEMAGISAEEAYARVHPDDREISVRQHQRIIAGEATDDQVEYRWQVKSGEYRWFSDRRKVVCDEAGQPVALVGISRDITAQKAAEAQLRASEAKYRTLFETMDEGLQICELVRDADGRAVDYRILEVNPAFTRITGISADRAIGRRHTELNPVPDARLLAICARVAETGEPQELEQYDAGFGRWFRGTFLARGGERFAVLFEDVTARKQYEEALLEHDRAKDEFLAVLSHELQTPLTAMLGWAEEALHRGDPELLAQAMPVIHRNALRQKRLVEDLLDISRLLHRKIELALEPLELGAQAALAIDNVRPQAEAQGVALVFVPPPAPLPVAGDPARLQQCLGNLLANSLKFTPAGGTITVRARAVDGGAGVTVEDTGRGLPPEALETVFEIFRQEPRDERAGGLGLGLAITARLVALHGGAIRAESDGPGRGCRFTLTFPLAEE